MCVCFSFTRGEALVQCFGAGPRAQLSANSFAGWPLVSRPSGLRIRVLLGCAWREQLRQPLRLWSPAWEGSRVCRPKICLFGMLLVLGWLILGETEGPVGVGSVMLLKGLLRLSVKHESPYRTQPALTS